MHVRQPLAQSRLNKLGAVQLKEHAGASLPRVVVSCRSLLDRRIAGGAPAVTNKRFTEMFILAIGAACLVTNTFVYAYHVFHPVKIDIQG